MTEARSSTRPIIVAMVVCTLAIVAAIVWPRYFPRYVDVRGGALDRWTGEECSTILSDIARERDPTVRFELCTFIDNPDRFSIRRELGGRWR